MDRVGVRMFQRRPYPASLHCQSAITHPGRRRARLQHDVHLPRGLEPRVLRPPEGVLRGQHDVQHHAAAPHVRALAVVRLAARGRDYLRRQVRGRAHLRPGRRLELLVLPRPARARQRAGRAQAPGAGACRPSAAPRRVESTGLKFLSTSCEEGRRTTCAPRAPLFHGDLWQGHGHAPEPAQTRQRTCSADPHLACLLEVPSLLGRSRRATAGEAPNEAPPQAPGARSSGTGRADMGGSAPWNTQSRTA